MTRISHPLLYGEEHRDENLNFKSTNIDGNFMVSYGVRGRCPDIIFPFSSSIEQYCCRKVIAME